MITWIFNSLQAVYILCTLAQVTLMVWSSIEARAADSAPQSAPFYIPLLALTAATASFNIWRIAEKIIFRRSGSLLTFCGSTAALIIALLGYDAFVFLYTLRPTSNVFRIAAQVLIGVRLAYM